MPATPLKSLFGSSDALARLRDHAARLVRLQRRLERSLPAQMRGAVSVANFENGTLILHANTPALASRLKMTLESLRADLLAANEPVQEIRVKVRAVHSSERNGLYAKETRQIGEAGKSALQDLSTKIDSQSDLGRALRGLIDKSR